MKIRQGFVSNSSSSSFLIVLPDDYDIGILYDEYVEACEEEENTPLSKEKFQALKNINERQYSLFGFFGDKIWGDWKRYQLAGFDTSSESGSINIMRESQVVKFLADLKKEKL